MLTAFTENEEIYPFLIYVTNQEQQNPVREAKGFWRVRPRSPPNTDPETAAGSGRTAPRPCEWKLQIIQWAEPVLVCDSQRVAESENVVDSLRVQPHEDFIVVRCQHSCNHGKCFYIAVTYTMSLKRSCNTPSEPRSVLSLLCPCAVRYNPPTLIFVGFIPFPSHLFSVSALSRLPVICAPSQKCHKPSLCALDALEAAEVPAFLQTCSDARQLLSEGAGQPRQKSLHLAGVNLKTSGADRD